MNEAEIDYLAVAGRRLECAWHGPPPGARPTLVFLHEGLGCVRMWRDFPARLAEATGLSAFVYSRLGYGASDACALPRPLSYMHDEGLEVLPPLLEAAGIADAILVGHSDGASIALIYAGGTDAAPLRGLVLEAPHVFVERISVDSIAAAAEAYRATDLRAKLERFHGANVDCAFRGWNEAWLAPGFRDWNIEDYLPRVRVPVLAIQGEDDEYGTMAQVASIAARAVGSVETVRLADCGHAPHRDRPEAVLERTTAFVTGLL